MEFSDKDDRFKWSCLEVAESLHGIHTGRLPPLEFSGWAEGYSWLKWRLETWTPSAKPENELFDNAVKKLLEATLAESKGDWNNWVSVDMEALLGKSKEDK